VSDLERLLDFYGVEFDGSKGREQSIICPVHDERRASASLNLDKELWNCLACGAAGSVYDLVMKKEGLEFEAAVKFVEGITGESRQRGRAEPRARKRVPPGQGFTARNRVKVSSRRKRIEF